MAVKSRGDFSSFQVESKPDAAARLSLESIYHPSFPTNQNTQIPKRPGNRRPRARVADMLGAKVRMEIAILLKAGNANLTVL
jgi:hypothetical protein